MKKSLLILMTFLMAVCLAVMSFAAPSAADETADVTAELFADTEISTKTDGILGEAPEETITAKELMSVAVRLHSTLCGGNLSETYDLNTYYNYALNNGIFVDGVHAYGSEADIPTRAQVVTALYNAVSGKIDLTAINEVLDMIDVAPDAAYFAAASNFMKAGIITGYDGYGSFKPNNTVKRYELGLMVDRLLNPAERVTKEYTVYSSAEHIYLIDDLLHDLGARGTYTGASGWRIDYTGSAEVGTINSYANILRDYAVDDDMSTSRRIHTQDSGELVFETVYKVTAGNTVHFGFYDANGNQIAVAGWNNGNAYVGTTTTGIKLNDKKEPSLSPDVDNFNYYLAGLVRTRIVLNLDTGKYKAWMGSDYLGEANLTGTNLASVKIYTGLTEVSTVNIRNTHLYKNYKVNDVFRLENQNEAPVGYETNGAVTVNRFKANAANTGEVNSVKMVTAAGSATYAKRSFDKATGKVIAEAYILLDDGSSAITVENDAYFTLRSSGVDVLKVETKGNEWYAGATKLDLTTPNDEFTSNVWQWIRIEADVATQTALIKINGKVAAQNVPFLAKVDGFDALEFGAVGTTAGDTLWFDDIEVYETFVDVYNTDDDPNNDYVPEPVPLDTGDYILNMSVCNLWRNGSHYGWDWIRPFAELEPAIGYYDEGNPESMDWEIKYLTEHGIKNYMTCWYPISNNTPIKKPRMSEALHDGYFNAKYSDMMTFSLMYENSGCYTDSHKTDFMNNLFPLWMDWYFSDPRYCRITEDGKEYIFLTIYQYLYFLDMCCEDYDLVAYNDNGDLYLKSEYQPSGATPSSAVTAACADAVEMINWMEQQIIAAGYADGLIVVYGGSTQTDAAYKTMSQMGGDGIILYAWGKTACDVDAQTNLATTHTAKAQAQGIDLLTLATPGFNDIGWTSERPGYMTTEDFDTMLEWHKGKMSTNYGSSADSWKSKLITFDTWNEYGEGHYFFPTAVENYKDLGYGGFGYLDVVAEKFGGVTRGSQAAEANNTYPTEVQKARMGRLYPADNDHYIRRDMLEAEESPDDYITLGGWDFTQNTTNNNNALEDSPGNWQNLATGISALWTKDYFKYDSTNKCWYGKTNTEGAIINLKDVEGTVYGKINTEDVDFVYLKIGTSTGGATGKIYFTTTTDSNPGIQDEEQKLRNLYTTYAGAGGTEYYIPVSDFDNWTGVINGIRWDPCYKSGETVYLYALKFLAIDPASYKTEITVDNQKYRHQDYAEVREESKDEVYITATEGQGLYKLLHIVYNWNRNTNILKLDTPDGTTFQFTVGSNTALVNGESVTLEKAFYLYDGAPVLPLIFVLDNANYYYSYDYTNKKLNVTVANTFEMDDQIENGDAEGTNTTEFYSGTSGYSITVATDPDDSTNKVWLLTPQNAKVWNYIRTDFVWEAGKTYTIDFDVRRTGLLGDGSDHPEDTSLLVFNARYADTAGTNGVEHNPNETRCTITDSWQHFTIQYTVAETLDTTADPSTHQLTFYVDPYNDLGVGYMMDNIVIRETPLAFKIVNGDAEGSETDAFVSSNSKNEAGIGTETNGNKYWYSNCGDTSGRSWNYLIHQPTIRYQKGVTYYYRVKAKIGTNAGGSSTSTQISLNARYADSAKLGADGEWYAHTQYLMDKTGANVTFTSGADWTQCYGSFTVSHGYVPIDEFVVPSGVGTPREEITFFVNPDASYGVSFMIDDFEVTTNLATYESWKA